MDIGSSKAFVKAPHCIWSPIPPAELRGEPIEDLSTNGGFVSFGISYTPCTSFILRQEYQYMILLDYITDITGRHVEGKRLDKTVWNLLNFYAFVKYHVKVRTRLCSLARLLNFSHLLRLKQSSNRALEASFKEG